MLAGMRPGHRVEVQRDDGAVRRFLVARTSVATPGEMDPAHGAVGVVLVTCYPFGAVRPGGPFRFVVHACRGTIPLGGKCARLAKFRPQATKKMASPLAPPLSRHTGVRRAHGASWAEIQGSPRTFPRRARQGYAGCGCVYAIEDGGAPVHWCRKQAGRGRARADRQCRKCKRLYRLAGEKSRSARSTRWRPCDVPKNQVFVASTGVIGETCDGKIAKS